jgi:hypothetical protein
MQVEIRQLAEEIHHTMMFHLAKQAMPKLFK